MSRAIVCAALAVLTVHSASPSPAPLPPIFGPVMHAPFNQTIKIGPIFKWENTVDFYYDATTEPVGSSLYIHSKGQHDELCTSLVGKEFDDAPCTLLASTDTWRYVIYPLTNECCRLCNTTDYCGIISPTWLQQNATYQGTRVIDGQLAYGWLKVGGEENYYWALSDGTPKNYYEGYVRKGPLSLALNTHTSPLVRPHLTPLFPPLQPSTAYICGGLQCVEFHERFQPSPHPCFQVHGPCGLPK